MTRSLHRPRLIAAVIACALGLSVISSQITLTDAAPNGTATATSQDLATADDLLPRADEISCSDYESANWAGIRFTIKKKRQDQRYRIYIVQDDGLVRRLGSNGPYSWGPEGNYPYPSDTIRFPRLTNDQLGGTNGWSFTAKIYSVNELGEESNNWIGWYFVHASSLVYDCTGGSRGQRTGTGPPGTFPEGLTSGSEPVEAAMRLAADAAGEEVEREADDGGSAAERAEFPGVNSFTPTSPVEKSSMKSTSEASTSASVSPTPALPRTARVTTVRPTPSSPAPATASPQPSNTPTAPTTTTTPSVKAGVGDSPIPVRESFARLEDIDGRTHLVVSRDGAEVCSADVDGASRIEEANGELTVTVAGRTSVVDVETCELT